MSGEKIEVKACTRRDFIVGDRVLIEPPLVAMQPREIETTRLSVHSVFDTSGLLKNRLVKDCFISYLPRKRNCSNKRNNKWRRRRPATQPPRNR